MKDNRLNEKLFDVVLDEAINMSSDEVGYTDEFEFPELSEEATQKADNQKNQIYKNILSEINKDKRPHRIKHKKLWGLAAAVILLSAIAVTGISVRDHYYKNNTHINGTTLIFDYEKVEPELNNELKIFKYPNEIILPGKLPNDMNIVDKTIDENSVKLVYTNNYNNIYITETLISDYYSAGGYEIKNNNYFEEDITVLGMDGTITEISYEDNNKTYIVQWCSDNIGYMIDTDLSYDEVIILINNLKYLK